MTGLEALKAALGYAFLDDKLLLRALTHASVTHEENNQRLEFLGDAVLELCISAELFKQKRRDDEGGLTRRRQQLVCEEALFQVAQGLNLGAYLRMKQELVRSGGRRSPALLADAMEAVIGAVYLDGDIQAASDLVQRLWQPLISQADTALDAKGALQAYFQGQGLPQPDYQLTDQKGPPHQRVFEAAVLASGRELARAWGSTIKAAQQQAAEKALQTLKKEEADR